jgi:pilus assembly protein CpaB
MQMRSRTMIVGGATVALIGALVVFVYARNVTGHVGGEPMSPAYVASKDIPAGTKAESAMKAMQSRPVPTGLRPASAITSPTQLAGRTSVRSITKGEVITLADFGQHAAAPAAGLQIPTGYNAVTMNLGQPQGVAHYAQPGDIVDIYVTMKRPADTITKLLLQNVQVLANRSATASEASSSSGEVLLTLALRPDEAERVIFAKENGSLWFGLVRPGDKKVTTTGRTATNVL